MVGLVGRVVGLLVLLGRYGQESVVTRPSSASCGKGPSRNWEPAVTASFITVSAAALS